jgi:outer membrane protein assembly factor BamB
MKKTLLLTGIYVLFGLVLLTWLRYPYGGIKPMRVPIPENLASARKTTTDASANQGTLLLGKGKPSTQPGSWQQFRGPSRNAISAGFPISSTWSSTGPKVIWKLKVGEGHAGVAVHQGRVYLLDYDETLKEDVIRCLSLDQAEELWRYTYSVRVKRNHGMSRTVPAVTDQYVVTIGPKCHVTCLSSVSGELVFRKDLVAEYGTRIPEWYAGQCPLIDHDRLILAPGGSCLMTALELATGNTIWQTPNPDGWQMSHSSILPLTFEGQRMYLWCSSGGVVAVAADTGALLWKLPEWKIKIATIPTPIDMGQGKLLFTGGYNAGCAAYQIHKENDLYTVRLLYQLDAKVFGSDQQTPIFYNNLIYGIIPGGKLACLSPQGKPVWVEEQYNFGLGPYLIIDNKLLVLDDDHTKPGELCLFRIEPNGVTKLAGAKVVEGHDAWAPLACIEGKVILRDSTTLVCLDLNQS